MLDKYRICEKTDNVLLEIIKKLPFIIMGNLMCSIAINGFFIPNKILSGGVTGISILVQYAFEVPISITIIVINLPLLVLATKKLDKKMIASTLISILATSILLDITKDIYKYINIDDILLAAVFGAVFNGLGMGLLYRNRILQSGVDVIGAMLKKYYNISIGSTLMGLNTVIVAISSTMFGIKLAMYTIISMYIGYQIVDRVQIGFNTKQNVFIVSDKWEELANIIMDKVHRGVTFLQGEGAYTNHNRKMIYCIVTSTEIAKIKAIVEEIDPDAFMTIHSVQEVKGSGFKQSGL